MAQKKYFDAVFKDEFNFDPIDEELEPWSTIAREVINEDKEEREEKISEFLKACREDEFLAKWRVPEDKDRWEKRERLIKFLRAGAWDVEAALQVLRNYLESGILYTSIVKLSIPKELDVVWSRKLNTVPEYRDVYGRRIYIYRPGSWNPDEVSVDQLFASAYTMFELIAEEVKTQLAGVTCVVDMYGFGFKQLRNIGIEQVKCMTGFMAGSFPIWVRRIHIVNNPRLFGVLHNMMKPFLDDRVKDNMIFHGSDYTELHKEVPPFLLPPTMGGQQKVNNDRCVQLMKERNDIYVEIMQKSLANST